MMTPKEIATIAVKALDDKKARDITVLKTDKKTVIADYFVICHGTSSTHIKALVDEVDKQLSEDTDDEFFDKLNECSIFSGDYDDVFSDMDSEYYEVFRYLIYIARSYEEVANEFIENTVHKYLDEIDIPITLPDIKTIMNRMFFHSVKKLAERFLNK